MKKEGTVSSSTTEKIESLGFINQAKTPALIIVILTAVFLILLYFLNIKVKFEPAYLSLTLYLVFFIIPSFIIALITSRGFLRTGTWPVLWLGIGALTYGIANLLSNLLLLSLSMNNAAVTTGNLIIFLSTIFYLFGSFFTLNKISSQENKSKRLSIVMQVYLGALILITFITIISIKGLLPPFFIQGVGGTVIRQLILGLSTIFLLISSLMILRQYSESKSAFLYWYGLGLILISLGSFGALLTTTLGSPFNWMARVTQLLGGVYIIVATIIIFKTAKAKNIQTEDALISFFSIKKSHLDKLLKNIADAIIISDNNSEITGWNKAAEKTYGWTEAEALGKNSTNLLQTHYPDEINQSHPLNDH
jgi:PAS domain-containing protein